MPVERPEYRVLVEQEGFKCLRCGHKWVPRVLKGDEEPTICPRCKSPYWNKPRKTDRQAVPDKRVKRKD